MLAVAADVADLLPLHGRAQDNRADPYLHVYVRLEDRVLDAALAHALLCLPLGGEERDRTLLIRAERRDKHEPPYAGLLRRLDQRGIALVVHGLDGVGRSSACRVRRGHDSLDPGARALERCWVLEIAFDGFGSRPPQLLDARRVRALADERTHPLAPPQKPPNDRAAKLACRADYKDHRGTPLVRTGC